MEALAFCTCLTLITFSFCVINITNPVHSALYLVCAFLNAALILFFLDSDFLGFVFILIYVGAIAVFFLLVIMMLNIKADPAALGFLKYGPLSLFIGFVFIFEFSVPFISSTSLVEYQMFNPDIYWTEINLFEDLLENCEVFGQVLYTSYFVYLLLVGLILLIALLGSMLLTVSGNQKHGNTVKIFKSLD